MSNKSKKYFVLCTCALLGEVRSAGEEIELDADQAKRFIKKGYVRDLSKKAAVKAGAEKSTAESKAE